MVELSIFVLSYNTCLSTIHCLESLVKQYKKELSLGTFEVIVVDNNSLDDSLEKISEFSKKNKNVILIKSKENLGFGKGNNLAATKAKGNYYLFLNSDTEVLDRGILDMLDFLKSNEKAGVVGGKLEEVDGKAQSSVGSFYTIFNLFFLLFGGGKMGMLRESPRKIKEVDWVSGALFLIRSSVFEKVEGFDPHFFMYMEDMDLCYRIRQKGLKVFFFPGVSVRHVGEGSSNRSFAIISIYTGILYFFKKHKSGFEYLVAKMLLQMKASLLIVVGLVTRNSYLWQTYKKAIQLKA